MPRHLLRRISLKQHLTVLFTTVAAIPVALYTASSNLQHVDPVFAHPYIFLGLGLMMAFSVGLFLASRMADMLRRLLGAMQIFAAGDYDKRAELTDWVIPAEILGLTDEFNRMGDQIARAWQANQEQFEQLQTANTQLAQLDQFKSDLIDAVSHEFRTPLTSIKGYAATLLRKDAPFDETTRRRLLKIIKDQADRLSRLVDDLLTIPKLDAGAVRYTPRPLPLLDALTPALALFPDREVHVELDKDLPLVAADPDRLEQVFVNLIENAHKYAPAEAHVYVQARRDGPLVNVAIRNACEPIPAESLAQLFTKFYRLDNRLTRTTRGTGLGLYLTKGLIEGMGGSIDAHVGQDFVISFSLPSTKPTSQLTAPLRADG